MLSKIVSLISLPAVLAVASGLERWQTAAREQASRTFEFGPLGWTVSLIHLIYAGLLAGLFWWHTQPTHRSRLVGIVYVVIGLPLALYPLIAFSGLVPLPHSQMFMLPLARGLPLVGAFAAFVGLYCLVEPARQIGE